MSSTKDVLTQLHPLPVVLSCLHLPAGISALHRQSGIEVSLPGSATTAPVHFKAIVSESTNRNLLLKSFYDTNVRAKAVSGTKYPLCSLADQGISRCAFTTTFGVMQGQPRLNDRTAPQFKVDGLSRVPFMHQGHFFAPAFLICDHIFCREEYEVQFVAVLSLEFLRQYFIRVQSTEKGWKIQLPPPPSTPISELLIYTDGCCLSNGQAAADPGPKPARGGYGIHFPSLPSGWDFCAALAEDKTHTNQRAELTAVIRALQLVRLRNIDCARISIFTDSKYAVQALNDWMPNLWRSNGYRTTKKQAVVNADLFKTLDAEVSLSEELNHPVTLRHVPREQNAKADALSKLGAVDSMPSMNISNPNKANNEKAGVGVKGKPAKGQKGGAGALANGNDAETGSPQMILGRPLFEQMRPLVQFSPDGEYWVECHAADGSGESLASSMEAVVV